MSSRHQPEPLWATRDPGARGVDLWSGPPPMQLSDGEWIHDTGTLHLAVLADHEAERIGLEVSAERPVRVRLVVEVSP